MRVGAVYISHSGTSLCRNEEPSGFILHGEEDGRTKKDATFSTTAAIEFCPTAPSFDQIKSKIPKLSISRGIFFLRERWVEFKVARAEYEYDKYSE